jgi:hypothetical protein
LLIEIQSVGNNLLFLPGRVVRCRPAKQHAFALGPRCLYNPPKQTLSKNPAAFNGLYGQTFHLFYTHHESIYYAGLYKAIDLRSEAPEGIVMSTSDVVSLFPLYHKGHVYDLMLTFRKPWEAMAEATLWGLSAPKINRVFATLYQKGLLKVEVLGLQCLECDMSIYDMLTSRFTSIQSAMNPVGNFGGYFPEAIQEELDEPKKKKQKIVS